MGVGKAATKAKPPDVSVIIPARNAAPFLEACLQSVLSQSARWVREVIVVDDGSTDRTSELAKQHHGVQVIRLEQNKGPSTARNVGIAAAKGALIAFLDADDLWPEGSLDARIAVLEHHPNAVLVFGDCRQFDERGPRRQTQFEAGGLGTEVWGDSGIVPDAYARLLEDNFITTGSVLVRRAAVMEAGGFADDLRLVEDLDLWLRIARRHVLAWCGTVCLLRRRHEANCSRDPVAMSLAYLEVLRRQAAQHPPPNRQVLRKISELAAREQLHLADLAIRSNLPADGMRWAMRSLITHPSMRALWRTGQATWQQLLGLGSPMAGDRS